MSPISGESTGSAEDPHSRLPGGHHSLHYDVISVIPSDDGYKVGSVQHAPVQADGGACRS